MPSRITCYLHPIPEAGEGQGAGGGNYPSYVDPSMVITYELRFIVETTQRGKGQTQKPNQNPP